MQLYVCGFAMHLSREYSRMLLVRDGDFLNGVSGLVGPNERARYAMSKAWNNHTRMFWDPWKKFAEFKLPDRECILYKAILPLDYLMEIKLGTQKILINPYKANEWDIHETLRWIIPLLLTDEPPKLVSAEW
jgi:hypothetical protein